MELLLVFLSTAVGTVVGVVAAIVMMNRRKGAAPASDSALKTQLQNTEWALASAGRDVEELRKQLQEREGVRDELERTQQQLVAIVGDKDRQAAERAEAIQRASELAAEAAALQERLNASETAGQRLIELEDELAAAQQRAADAAARSGEEVEQRLAELESEVAAARERATDAERSTEEAAQCVASLEAALMSAQQQADSGMRELSALRQGLDDASAKAQRVVELETALGGAEQQALAAANEASALRDRVEQLTTELSAARLGVEEAAKRIACMEEEIQGLEAQVNAGRERFQRAASDAAELETLLRKERQSAVEAMELLSQAQDKFSGSFAEAH